MKNLRPSRPAQQGQVVPLMAGVVVLVAMIGLGLAVFGSRMVDRARAQNAADAAALAAAVQPETAVATRVAEALAEGNHAEIVSVTWHGDVVVVRVRLGREQAVAAARPA